MLYRFESTVEVPSLAHPSPQMHGTTYAQKSASWSGLFEWGVGMTGRRWLSGKDGIRYAKDIFMVKSRREGE